MSDDIFETNENVQPATIDDLVGEGKRYVDHNALAKAFVEGQSFIDRLQNENSEMRTEIQSRQTVEELLNRMPTQSNEIDQTPNRQPNVAEQVQEAGAQAENREDFEERVRRLLAEEKSKASKEANVASTREGLKERFGADYNQKLLEISESLGVSKEFLTDMAKTSPQGFLKLIDSVAAPDSTKPSAPPVSSVDPQKTGLQAPKVKTKRYYNELRKSDPSTYFSRRVQNEMHDQAMKLGQAFYQ